ncbi:outer membrane protein assembly factor BamA [Desulfobacter sp.]|uniref:outer membrane protein assembly factor BamA n=1 Tax=Desulfobacter sp. TaxID=2294 RepID=UPI000E874625|nr:outer membrane protein assembly factor BamA [Desulfobacter sp.]HBT89687.1 outer membrane protein assembly factor BamA [Desulfobacter sp.]
MKHIKFSVLLATVFCLWGTGLLCAEERVAVALFPFHVQAEQSDEKIAPALSKMLKEKFEKDGATVVVTNVFVDTTDWNYEQFRQEGVRLGVDWILTGDIFIAGQAVSIDAQMHNVYKKQAPLTFFSQSPSLSELYAGMTSLEKDIIGELFQQKIISAITIKGNVRVDADAIQRVISSRKGDLLNRTTLGNDLSSVYKMGYFDDVVIKKENMDKGVEVIFEVREKPSVRNIRFENNHVYEEKELFEVIGTSTGSILNAYKLNTDVDKLKRLYYEKNYYNCRISYDVKPLKNHQADIIFNIDEGEKVKITKIEFEGNKYFDDDDIKDEMKIKEKGFWSFITSSGELNETELDNDVLRIESFYNNNGFINVKVSDPVVNMGTEEITIQFKIDEGEQYKNGVVHVTGDILTTEEELLALLVSQKSKLYNRELVRKDMITLNDFYANQGYANVRVTPRADKNDADAIVNISFDIDKGSLVYFNRIIITGNKKTRDKVIRRELAIDEQDLYSMAKIQRSNRNLVFKDYFQNIDIKPVKTEEENRRDVQITVEEKPTGNFSFGGGFSSDDGAFGQVSVEERNLFGKGQTGKFTIRMSGENALYNIGFTEPWLFDRAISAGFDIYKFENEYDYYEKDAMGLTLRAASRRFWDYTTIGLIYNIEKFDIEDVESDYTSVSAGNYLTSSITPYVSYDSRNHSFLPTKGMYHKVSVEYAGEFLGGEIDFTKYLGESALLFPLFWKFSAGIYAKGGYLDDRTNGDPDIDWERFYLGGINSIRGFDDTDINGTRNNSSIEVGGEKYFQFNIEMMFPIVEEQAVYGVFFYDRGDVYNNGEDIDFGNQFSSSGFELRWNSPMGPIRLAYGIVIDGKDVRSTGDGQFDFSIGAFF